MSTAFCSIVTPGDLGAALAVNASISRFAAIDHVVLVACAEAQGADLGRRCPPNLRLVFLDSLCSARKNGAALYDAFGTHGESEVFRRAMKPVLMMHVLDTVESVIHLDVDRCFFASPAFLFDELRTCNLLLAPQWRCWEPGTDAADFERMFSEGFFDGGLVGASRGGRPALDWWAEACLYSCDKNKQAGHYVDQRYLDVLALESEGVRVLPHKGCNVAAWNRWACPRSLDANGRVLIDGQWPLVCARFAGEPVDEALRPSFEEYLAMLVRHAPELVARWRAETRSAPASTEEGTRIL